MTAVVRRLTVEAPLDSGEGAAVLAAYGDVFGDAEQGRAMLIARRAEPGCSCVHVCEGNAVVAFAWGASVPDGSWWPTRLAASLGPVVAADVTSGSSVAHLGVRAGHRRRGLGGVVLDALLDDLAGIDGPVHLGTEADNDAARRLYQGRGFGTVAVYRHPDDDRDWRLMRRPAPA